MHFEHGMACCNRFRARAGLCCDLDRQLECATFEMERLAKHAPDDLFPYLLTLCPIFPPDMLLIRARHIGHINAFIKAAAFHCATLRTKTERRLFADFIAGYMTTEQIQTFQGVLASEWGRLRGK
ncbi:hypothetical protein [Paraburkholderia sp. J41]|uniref:hypothetical protein n=1 Tax=Paraburkholderia sp. J41 TaxID=2805433 RepID=UPI002AC36D02|nr:hypothetical protein [Paraburkholderia sp. J41]